MVAQRLRSAGGRKPSVSRAGAKKKNQVSCPYRKAAVGVTVLCGPRRLKRRRRRAHPADAAPGGALVPVLLAQPHATPCARDGVVEPGRAPVLRKRGNQVGARWTNPNRGIGQGGVARAQGALRFTRMHSARYAQLLMSSLAQALGSADAADKEGVFA